MGNLCTRPKDAVEEDENGNINVVQTPRLRPKPAHVNPSNAVNDLAHQGQNSPTTTTATSPPNAGQQHGQEPGQQPGLHQNDPYLEAGLQPNAEESTDLNNMMPTAPFQWQKGRQIGQGGFGTVYMGLVHATGQEIAVKQVSLPRDTANGQVQIFSLEREVAVLRKLRHENIVRYLGTERTVEHLNIFLEYVAGGSLSNKLSQFGPLREETIRVYTKQILRGVQYLHQHRVMHRDIKGANILVDTTGVVKLADFGASKQLEELATIGGGARSLHGTAHWMAPEVIRQQGHGCQADIWSLACVVIEMATGRPPWAEYKNPHSVMYHVASTRDLPPMPEFLSPQAKDFLTLCFNRVPRERPNATRLLSHPWMEGVVVPRADNVAPNPMPAEPTFQIAAQPSPRLQAQIAAMQPAVQSAQQKLQPSGLVSSPIKEGLESHFGLITAGTPSNAAARPVAVPPLRLDMMKPGNVGTALPGQAQGFPAGPQRTAQPSVLSTGPGATPPKPLLTPPSHQAPNGGYAQPNQAFEAVGSKVHMQPPSLQPPPLEQQQEPVPQDAGAAGTGIATNMMYSLTANPYDSISCFNPLVEPSWMPSQHPAQLEFLRQLAAVPEHSAPGSPAGSFLKPSVANAADSGPCSTGGSCTGGPHAPADDSHRAVSNAPPAPVEDAAALGSMPRKGTGLQRGTAHGTKAVIVPSRPPLAGIFAAAYEESDPSVTGAVDAIADREYSPCDPALKCQPASQPMPRQRASVSRRGIEETGVLGGGTLDPARAKQWRDELEAELAAERAAMSAVQRDPEALPSARAAMVGRPSVADL